MMLQTSPRSAPGGPVASWRTRQLAVAPTSTLAISASLVGVAIVTSPAVAVAFVPAAIAASHDATTRRLPDRWVVTVAAAAAVCSIMTRGLGSVDLSVASALLAGVVLLAFHLISPRALGFGDVKLAAALGPLLVAGTSVDTFTGIASLVAIWLCVASAAALAHAVVARRSAIPFGPGLVVGVALVLTWGGIVR